MIIGPQMSSGPTKELQGDKESPYADKGLVLPTAGGDDMDVVLIPERAIRFI